jgi:hypothetical protein
MKLDVPMPNPSMKREEYSVPRSLLGTTVCIMVPNEKARAPMKIVARLPHISALKLAVNAPAIAPRLSKATNCV